MKSAIQLLLSGLVLALIVAGCSGPAGTQKYEEKGLNPKGKQAGSAAHGTAAQPTTQTSSNENYGEEVSRLVYEKDEIVSVLKNGMVVIANGKTPGILERVFQGEEVGTLFLPGSRMAGKRRWLAFATTVRGEPPTNGMRSARNVRHAASVRLQ